jgi:5,10-methylenetetrahydromethanopterin reductase
MASPSRRQVTRRVALATGSMPLDAVVAAAREAEELGYEAVLAGEVGLEADAFVVSAAVLAATARIRCGPGIANAYDRHPVALARAAATLDRLAPGRALLGIGRSEGSWPSGALELPWDPSPLGDAVRITRELLAGRAVDHRGARWSAHTGPAPQRAAARHRVPVLLAAVGPRTLGLAGALADGVLLNYGAPVEYVGWALDQLRAGASQAGRDADEVDVYGYLLVACLDAPDAARRLESARQTLAALHAIPDQGRWLGAPAGGSPARWDEAALRRFAVVGSRQECLARIDEYRAAGVRCPVLMPSAMRALHAPAGTEWPSQTPLL